MGELQTLIQDMLSQILQYFGNKHEIYMKWYN